jgi:hypothetical protein
LKNALLKLPVADGISACLRPASGLFVSSHLQEHKINMQVLEHQIIQDFFSRTLIATSWMLLTLDTGYVRNCRNSPALKNSAARIQLLKIAIL